jgi:hypothetical protein
MGTNCYFCSFSSERQPNILECTHPDIDLLAGAEAAIKCNLQGMELAGSKIGIKIDPQGQLLGRAFWPIAFDPIWIECSGYMPKLPQYQASNISCGESA